MDGGVGARDAVIVRRVLGGEPLAVVAADVGLSRQRVGQIVQRDAPGVDFSGLRRAAAAEVTRARHALTADARRRAREEALVRRRGVPRVFSDEEIVRVLQGFWLGTGDVPTVMGWRALGLRPSPPTVVKRFGSWNAALMAAGLPVRASSGRARVYSDEELVAGVREFLAGAGPGRGAGGAGCRAYGSWACASGAGSLSLLRSRFGSWGAVKRLALSDPRFDISVSGGDDDGGGRDSPAAP